MPAGSSAPSPSATRRSSVVNSSFRMKLVRAAASGCAHGGLGERHLERHMRVENDQRLRQPRLVGEADETLAPLVLLDLGGACEQRFEVAELVDEERRGLHPDARHARNVVGGIADQRLHLDHLRRRHAEALQITSASPITLFFMVSYMRMPGCTSCIRSLSEETIVTSAPASTA